MMGWSTFPIRKEAKKLWKTALFSLLWAVWKERNRVTFDNLNLPDIGLNTLSFPLSPLGLAT